MDLQEPAAENRSNAPGVERSRQNGTVRGHWLILARGMCIALFGFSLTVFFADLPGYFAQLHTICASAICTLWQLTPTSVQALQKVGLSVESYTIFSIALSIISVFVWSTVGAVIAWRKSNDWMALLVAVLLVTTGISSQSLPDFNQLSTPFVARSSHWFVPTMMVSFVVAFLYLLTFLLFPDGRFVPRWTRWLVVMGMALTGGAAILFFFFHTPFQWFNQLIYVGVVGTDAPGMFAQLYRYRYVSTPIQRQQTKWIVLGVMVGLLVVVGGYLPPLLFSSLSHAGLYYVILRPVATLMLLFAPLCFAIAILRYRLWDIDVIINRTLVYTALSACVIGLYVLVVVGLGSLLQAQGNILLSLLATGLIAVLFQPLRQRLQQAVNRLLYGERDDPYRVLSRLGQRLEATLAPDAVLPTIVETVVQALKLPYAAIRLQQGEEYHTAASYGSARGELVRLPLVSQSEQVGELVLAPRAAGESFTPADRALLSDLARQVGMAVHAVRLMADLKRFTVDLQRSRELLVTAREEERRRLRRDLHDGLGPQLASLTLKLETARNRLAHDPLADTLLADLAQRTQATVAEIRRLVYALRPPALDELGLVSALCALTLQSSDQVAMHIDAPPCLPELPAAVEVAIYRIAQEALTNVVRHAHAQRCELRLALDEGRGWLSLSIQDDGCGLPPLRPVGIGMTSMRERAEELGGTWSIAQVPTGGTRILTRMPYAHPEKTDTGTVTTSRVPQEEE